MRRPALVLLLSSMLLCAAARAATAAPAAIPAERFVNSIGVNVHMTYGDTAYRDRSRLIDILSRSGIRHVRDGLSHDTQYAYDSFNQLADRGIKTTFIMGDPTESRDTLEQLLYELRTKVRGAAEAVEGPNEFSRSGEKNWAPRLRTYQARLFRDVNGDRSLAGLPVLAPSQITWQDHAAVGNLTGSLDYGNKHSYPGGDIPEANVSDELKVASRISGNRRTFVTESGYHNALNTTSGHKPVSEAAAATYLPRMYLEYFRRGIPRTFTYELIDEHADPGKREIEDHFGLLRSDYSAKPAFRSLTNLISLLSDDGGKVTPRALPYSIEGAPDDLRQMVLQKSDGSHYLVLWRAVSVWDADARRPIRPDTRTATVALGGPSSRARLFSPVDSRRAFASTSASRIPVRLGANPVVIEVDKPDQGISVPARQRVATVARKGLRVRLHGASRAGIRIQARRRSRVIGRLSTSPRAARVQSVRIQPTRAGRRLLRSALHRRRGLVLTVRARLANGSTVTRQVALRH